MFGGQCQSIYAACSAIGVANVHDVLCHQACGTQVLGVHMAWGCGNWAGRGNLAASGVSHGTLADAWGHHGATGSSRIGLGPCGCLGALQDVVECLGTSRACSQCQGGSQDLSRCLHGSWDLGWHLGVSWNLGWHLVGSQILGGHLGPWQVPGHVEGPHLAAG